MLSPMLSYRRHIFRLQIMAPIGYHIELFSDHYFILTNEDGVFVHMNEVSACVYISACRSTHLVWLSHTHLYLCICMISTTYHLQEGKLMLAYGCGIVSNLLEMVTICDNTAEHTPSLKDQVTELRKVNFEDNHIQFHLYKVVCVCTCVCVFVCFWRCLSCTGPML